MRLSKDNKGFGLVEIVVGIGVFLLFAVGIYNGMQYVFKVVFQSRLRIVETAVLNEQIEVLRNMPFEDVGIIDGSPAGVLARTVTTSRSGMELEVTRTIRSIDDPYDGTIDGIAGGGGNNECQGSLVPVCHSAATLCVSESAVTGHVAHGDAEGPCGGEAAPVDNAPADYKFIEVAVTCPSCLQRVPLTMSTIIAPKYLEGNPNNGALFVEVFTSEGVPVQGATVHITATSTDPVLDFVDTTDNDGVLRLVDLPAALDAYHINVAKEGYTSDNTITPSDTNTNPVKPPASVIAQDVSSVSFSINPAATVSLETLTSACAPLGQIDVHVRGNMKIGTQPDVYKVDETITTDALGEYVWSNLDPVTYFFTTPDVEIQGAIPSSKMQLQAGGDHVLQLIVGADTGNSLRVAVTDSVTEQPIADVEIELQNSSGTILNTKRTGLGSFTQTDWSGGAGQTTIGQVNRYFADDGLVDVNTTPGNLTLTEVGSSYVSDGWLESSTFDLGTEANFVRFTWEPFGQPVETGEDAVRVQIATSNSSTPATWEFLGPDGTSSTYYVAEDRTIHDDHDGERYARYRIYLHTDDQTTSPSISSFGLVYTTSCTPPGEVYFPGIAADTFVVRASKDGYQSTQQEVEVADDVVFDLPLFAQ